MINCNQKIRTIAIYSISLYCFGSVQADVASENRREIERLVEMTRILHAEGVDNFVTRCAENKWAPPKLYSAWYIGRLPNDPEGKKQVEEAKSKLGLELACQLSVIAKTVRETKEIPVLEQASNAVFAVTKWVGTESGYGNLFIQDRAYDIASVAAVKFMADLAYPIEKADATVKRFDWSWGDPSVRKKILFEESGGMHFKPSNTAVTAEEVDSEFSRGLSLALKYQDVEAHPDLAIFVIEDIPPNESFAAPETTWQRRGHFMIGKNTFGSVNLRNLSSLREFRKRYGKFPTKPVNYKKSDSESEIEAAFWELCWEDPHEVHSAYMVYEAYFTGRLADKAWNVLRDRSKIGPQSEK
jgi:hypothetical protein